MKFRCKDIVEHASFYLDKELSLVERANYRLHLLICKQCRRFVTQFRLTQALIRSAGQSRQLAESQVNVATQVPNHVGDQIRDQVALIKKALKE